MAKEIDKLFKGFSIKEIEEILFNTAVGVKKIERKRPATLINLQKFNIKQPCANWVITLHF